jgi:hypothetical protein
MIVGDGDLRYELAEGWEQLPAGWEHRDVAGVAVDSQDRVYLLTRGDHPVIVYERDGSFVGSWGEGQFTLRTHGITVGPDDGVYCVDDGDHTVRKFTTDGKLLLTLGTSGQPSDTGYTGTVDSITHGGPPFNRPTNVSIAPSGDLYVSDGYGNARVHRFSADGQLLQSWGEPGGGPGEFRTPHGIWAMADGRVLVADRENDRIQVFSPTGEYLTEWTDIQRPTAIFVDPAGLVYVSELWWRVGQRSYRHGPIEQDRFGRVSILDGEGRVLSRWGGFGPDRCAPGDFCAPHGLYVDSRGDVYVGEVTYTFAGQHGIVPPDCHTLQKFVRVR